MTTPTLETLLPRLHPQLRLLIIESASGHLPILRKTAQDVLFQTRQGNSSSADIARLAEQDPGMCGRLLHVANSLLYPSNTPITTTHRAVAWLGLETIYSLVITMQILEQLAKGVRGTDQLPTLIAQAILAATQAQDLGIALKHPHKDELFSTALLYNLADMAIAYHAPGLHKELQALSTLTTNHRILREESLIGIRKSEFAYLLSKQWALPPTLVQLIHEHTIPSPDDLTPVPWTSPSEQFVGLVQTANLYAAARFPAEAQNQDRCAHLETILLRGTQLSEERFRRLLAESIEKGTHLLRAVGINEYGQISPLTAPPTTLSTSPPTSLVNLTTSLRTYQTDLEQVVDLNQLINVTLAAMQRHLGLKRIALALVAIDNPDKILGRYQLGVNDPTYLQVLTGSLRRDFPLFLHLLKSSVPSAIANLSSHPQVASKFLDVWQPRACLIAPIRLGTRPIAFLYADQGPHTPAIDGATEEGFQQFHQAFLRGINHLASRQPHSNGSR